MPKTYLVDPNGNGTHLTVQAAIHDARRGDTVQCVPFVYTETLRIPDGVTLTGAHLSGPHRVLYQPQSPEA